MPSSDTHPRPPFSSLPLDPNGPPGNAWGLYGKDDRLGALNLLTPAVVAAAAASEIRTGDRVSLDWSLNNPSQPSFGRAPFESKLVNRAHPSGDKRTVNDDILHFNTQCSSQWDGFRHYGYQKAKRYYNNTTQDDLENPEIIGIDAWVEKGGIVGRGVLLDYAGFCARNSIPLDAFASSDVSLRHLQQIAAEQNITFRPGDILFIRSGFTAGYNAKNDAAQKAVAARSSPDFLGVEPTKDVLRWIWDTGFAAVAGDAPSFERAPIAGPHTAVGGVWKGEVWEDEMQGGGLLHQWLLGGWGLPIGEMFDLEALSAKCQELGRWTFFVSSVPLRVPGGVASPPNAVAIF
ncbi:putative cyclase [Colletotrichum incanum]|nr:putative cyclase [Colletotrichum incanum]